jgi:nucleoside-diphosphate-sugar epimerase
VTTALLLGYGFAAQRFATVARLSGVHGTTRSAEKASRLDAVGVAAHVWDGGAPDEALLAAATDAEIVLVTPPPDDEGCPVHRALGAALGGSKRLRWLGYLSTTGVYGDRQGRWAFEEDLPTPGSARARRRVLAERQWLDGVAATRVFRLPGIYGPGRSQLDRARAGDARRIVRPGLVMNRIHVEDIARALAASLAATTPLRVFNLADDLPAEPAEVVAEACRLLDLPIPAEKPLEESGLTGLAYEFYTESKRVSTARAKAALGWRPLYPTYREGLRAVLAEEEAAERRR